MFRLSRARRIVENAFGILTHTWRILLKRIHVGIKFARKIVRACVALHNFLRMTKSDLRMNVTDQQEEDSVNGNDQTENVASISAASMATNRSTKAAMEMKNKFSNWCTNEGDVAFQYKMI